MADHPPESPDPTAPLDPAAAADPAFVAYVATCAEAIAAGQPPPPPPTADLSDRCARVRSTLRLLDRVRRTAAPDSRPTILGDDPPTTPWTGAFANARIGRYELIRELGRGGMGMVYLARDPDLDRTVALKVIAGAGTDRDRWLARFRAEGRILARLDHPNIVRVYKAGEADGSPFLVMEHVAGPSLHSHLGGRPMPPRDAAGLVEVVARGVDYAHRQGVIHRDLKPANILLENDEFGAMNDDSRPPAAGRLRNTSDPASRSSLTPKVTDFGLATPAGGGSDLTRTGELIGTPGYLAPEVIAGGAATGPEVDIYGLGAVLYECLTGRPAFAGTNLAVTLMLIQHTNSTPPRKLNPAVPRDLETICLACMRKDPARRYRSAAAVADDLAAFLTGRPIQARPVGAAEAVLKWARRSPAVAALSAATALTLVAGTAVSTYFAAAASARAEREAAAALAAGIAEDDARKAHAEAVAAKEASDLLAARLRFQDAVRRAEAGEVEVGLFGMADALRLAPACPAAADFRRAVRLSFAAWGRQFPVLRHAAKLSDQPLHKIWVGPVGPDGSVYAAWCPGQPVRLLDAATGRPAGEPCELPADERPLVLSPDGGLILTRAWDERSDATIRLRRLQGGAVVGVPVAVPLLPVHQGVPDRESFVLSARVVMTGGADSAPLWGPRRFWDLETGTAHPLVVSDKNLAAVRLLRAADGRAIVVVVRHSDPREGADVRAEFWDVATGKPLEAGVRLDDRSDPHVQGGGRVVATVFGDDAGCTAGADGSVAWWEVGTGRLLGRWRPNRDAGLSFLTSDGQTLVAFSADERVRLYDPDTGLQRGGNLHLPEGAAPRLGIVAVPGNPVLATLDGDGVLRGWAIGHPERQATAAARPRAGHPGPGQAAAPYSVAALSPSGRSGLLGAGQRSGYGRLVSSETGRPVGPPLLHQLYRGLIAFTPDERAVATTRYNFWVGGSQEVHLYDTATARPLAPPVPLPTYAHGIAASPDGKTVAVARLVSTTLIDVDTGRIVRELPEKTCVAAVAFHPDGTRLAAAGRHGWHGLGAGFRLWDPAAGRPLGDFHGLADVPTTPSVHFLDGGRTVLAYGADTRSTALLDVASGVVRPGPRLPGRVAALAVRGDGPVVAVGSADGGVGQVNLTDGAAVGPPMPQPYPVTGLEYSPDGGLLAVACADRTVRLWDTATGLPVGPPLFHAGEVLAVRFASAGREVVSATAAGEVRRWPLPDPAPDDPDALGLWVEVAAGRGGDGRLLDPVAWEGRRADLGRRWPDGAAALDRVRTGPAADADWHDARAREAEATGNTFAAVWHLDRLARARPADWHAHARRADALLRAGDAAGAAAADAEAGRLAGPAVWADWLAHRADGGAAGGR